MTLLCASYTLVLDRPLIMGIVNLTPDSFSGDGVMNSAEAAIAHAHRQVEEGADLLDIGAESSRPGAVPTDEAEELRRLLPVLKALRGCGVPISIDTYKPAVMEAALAAGAAMINDISGFRDPRAVDVVAGSDCGVCIMHMQGEPLTMQEAPSYSDVVVEVTDFLEDRLHALAAAGVAQERMLLDPGFGFGKTLEHNLALLRALGRMQLQGRPVLAGLSRKSMLGAITGRPVNERLAASLSAAVLAADRGAAVLRVHDVAATRDALAVLQAIKNNEVQGNGNG